VARAAAVFAGDGVVGLDVAGDELLQPAQEPFVEPFRIAAAAGLGLTAHAAEAGPASSVRDAVEILGATRIGHGSRVIDDPETLAWSIDHGLTFEVCPTSNVLTGAARSLRDHPIHAFLAAGAGVVLGDDDPITIGRRLAAEVRDLEAAGGLTMAQLDEIAGRSVEVAFLDESVRAALRTVTAAG
jgi:adenosine deaminase